MKNILYLYVAFLLLFLFSASCQAKDEPEPKAKKRVRLPVVSGQFYPAEREKLAGMVRHFLKEAGGKPISGNIRGLVSPHAGYMYSGIVAAAGYRQVAPDIKTVFVLAPSHSVGANKASIPDVDFYRTPLGDIPLSPIAASLRQQELFSPIPAMHQREHSLEVQIPFLQERLEDFELVPIIIGQTNPKPIADALLPYLKKDTLLVASSDLSHYYSYQEAKTLDSVCTEAITALQMGKMAECEACGKIPLLVLMEIAQKKGWKGQLLDYRNSGDTGGPKDQVVGYASIAFVDEVENKEAAGEEKETAKTETGRETISEKDKKVLLDLARRTITEALTGKKSASLSEDILSPFLKEKRGCFVTLHKKGSLRGCIGTILPHEQLYRSVQENAINAAFRDPRFSPLQAGELDQIDLEISVLTKPRRIQFKDSEDLKQQLRPGRDGVILSQGWHRATYLPQVWEQLPDKESFLQSLCLKAGLSRDAWKGPNIEVELYEAIVFSE
ncbi:MAG: AmmeMemoRadiSam system protein B [bacterium]